MTKVTHGGRGVKKVRSYDSTLRREQAGLSRHRILDIAERRFLNDGYAVTTIGAIAEQAGVSVDTIYKSFGGKAGLIRGIRERALRGAGPVPAETRSDQLHVRERDPRRIIRAWGRLTREISPRSSPILLLVRDAASTDPELRAMRDELDADRLRRMTDNARRLSQAGHLRPGVGVAEAARVLWTYSSPELYELLVLRGRMPLKEYGKFVSDAIAAALL